MLIHLSWLTSLYWILMLRIIEQMVLPHIPDIGIEALMAETGTRCDGRLSKRKEHSQQIRETRRPTGAHSSLVIVQVRVSDTHMASIKALQAGILRLFLMCHGAHRMMTLDHQNLQAPQLLLPRLRCQIGCVNCRTAEDSMNV
jgi:hypothetical protein